MPRTLLDPLLIPLIYILHNLFHFSHAVKQTITWVKGQLGQYVRPSHQLTNSTRWTGDACLCVFPVKVRSFTSSHLEIKTSLQVRLTFLCLDTSITCWCVQCNSLFTFSIKSMCNAWPGKSTKNTFWMMSNILYHVWITGLMTAWRTSLTDLNSGPWLRWFWQGRLLLSLRTRW